MRTQHSHLLPWLLCLFVAALSHSVPSVCCFVVCTWLPLRVSSSPSRLSTNSSHHFSHFFLALPPLHVSASHLPMTKYLFSIFLLPTTHPPFCPSLSISSSHSLTLSLSLPPVPPAFGRELQSQLFILELLQAHHDGILVYTGLSSAGHQSHTHQLLLHTPHQLRGAHGPCGGQGRRLFRHACQEGDWQDQRVSCSSFD